ncbi:hypothetical protein [Variovorax sp. RCC_210]|uniref:hypothetical protein n=1 Tax=Variovorax sp. RCC_210 TaxID=3239217 RepID=UPI0035255281
MKNDGVEAVVVAGTDWHHWYECDEDDEQDDHFPHSHRRYQCDECNLDYYSELSDDDIGMLMSQLEVTPRMQAWRLGHFDDRHLQELATILDKGMLVEPCFESARLPWQAHLQLIHFGNPGVSRCLVEHMLRQGVSRENILEALASDDDIQGEENIEPMFASLLRDCEKTVLHERLMGQLGAKVCREKKVKI